MKKIIKVIYWLIPVIILSITALLAMSVLGLPRNIRSFVVLTGSMEPSIPIGSMIFVRPQADYKVGDVITVQLDEFIDIKSPGATITHRIEEIRQVDGRQVYITKGDANNMSDLDFRTRDLIVGKVSSVIPLVGYPVNFAKSQLGFMLLIVIPATIVIYSEILRVINEVKALMAKRKIYSQKPRFRVEDMAVIFLILLTYTLTSGSTSAAFTTQASISQNTVTVGNFSSTEEPEIPEEPVDPTEPIEPDYQAPKLKVKISRFSNQPGYIYITLNDVPLDISKEFNDNIQLEVNYFSQGIKKGFISQIEAIDVDINSQSISKKYFLGTCSDQICTQDIVDQGIIDLEITGILDNNSINIEESYCL